MSATSSTCGGKISTCRPYRPRTCSWALRTVAVDATISGRTGLPSGGLPGRQGLDGDLEQADRRAQRAGDQVQLVLDDQVRRPQPADRPHGRRRVPVWSPGARS